MKKTVLLDKHVKLGAKIVDFAGFKMPISYSSVTDEHNHVRENAVSYTHLTLPTKA